MASRGDAPVKYLCPHCRATLTAHHGELAGRRDCPACGRSIKVPGSIAAPGDGQSPPRADQPVAGQGIAGIAVICPICGTRMYATPDQVGGTMICPDCLETVAVPASRRPSPRSTQDAPRANAPATQPAATPVPPQSSADEDDLKLSDPVAIPAEYYVPAEFRDLINRASGRPDPTPRDTPVAGSTPAAPPRTPPEEFALKCPVCDTMIYAVPADIGSRKTCPDCYSSVEIIAPRKKPRKTSDVVESSYENDTFRLDEPADLDVYRQSGASANSARGSEGVLARAEREWERRRQEDKEWEMELEMAPLWSGLFSFLADPTTLARWILSALLLAGPVATLFFAVRQIVEGDGNAMAQFGAICACALTAFLTALGLVVIGITCQTILQDTAHGSAKVTQWPTSGYLDWISDSFPFAFALFYAVLPGVAVSWLTGLLGLPFDVSWLFLGLSLFVFFPIAQLSLLETDSLANPLSLPILRSFRDEFALWTGFYLISFALALPAAITIFFLLSVGTSLWLILGFSLVWAFSLFLYFRLLGRLAWICQVRPSRGTEGTEGTGEADSQRR